MEVFKNNATKDIYRGENTKDARQKCPKNLWSGARRHINNILSAKNIQEIKDIPGHRYKKLKGSPERSSVRISDQYRITFNWTEDGPRRIDIVDYH